VNQTVPADTQGTPTRGRRNRARRQMMTEQTASALPAGVDPAELDEALRAVIRVMLADRDMTRSQLLEKIAEVLGGNPPGSYMWLHRRIASGEVPLVRPAQVIPARVSEDLEKIATAFGTSSDELITRAVERINRADR